MTTDNNTNKRWFGLIFLLFCWMLIFSLAKDLAKVGSGFERIEETTARLKDAEEQNNELNKKLLLVQTDYYKEKIVREKINMQKQGETLVVLADKTTQPDTPGDSTRETEGHTDNWDKWWALVK